MSAEVFEVPYEVIEVSSSSSSPELIAEIVEEESATTTALINSSLQNNPVDWPAIQDLLNRGSWTSAIAIDGAAREQIEEALERQGMDGRHLKAYLERHPIAATARNPVGVLLSIVPKLKARMKNFDPDEPDPMSAFEQRQQGKIYKCTKCSDTGRLEGGSRFRASVQAACLDCETGRHAFKEDHRQIAVQLGHLDRDQMRERLDLLEARGGDRELVMSFMGFTR